MNKSQFKPLHISASEDELVGNNRIGRYILFPGSDGRAEEIAQHFENRSVIKHNRGHHLYLGTLPCNGKSVDVATISSGMGCPSMEIILHELFHLGAKRFLRVGTAGSMQPNFVNIGDFVNATAAVRDESTTVDYMPIEIPAIASIEWFEPIMQAANKLGISQQLHSGVVHCKSSFYAREFGAGPRTKAHEDYNALLTRAGVLATEMETAALFTQAQLYDYELKQQGRGPAYRVLAGAILGILIIPPDRLATAAQTTTMIENLIALALDSVKELALREREQT